jgi:hypothetical protein
LLENTAESAEIYVASSPAQKLNPYPFKMSHQTKIKTEHM